MADAEIKDGPAGEPPTHQTALTHISSGAFLYRAMRYKIKAISEFVKTESDLQIAAISFCFSIMCDGFIFGPRWQVDTQDWFKKVY